MSTPPTTEAADSIEPAGPPPDWVPVDQRQAGVDRRTAPYAIVVLAIGVLLGGILPLIDESVAYADELAAGDVLDLGGGLTFDPPDGWFLVAGSRVDGEPAAGRPLAGQTYLASGATRILIEAGPFDGSPEELLEQVNENKSAVDGVFSVSGETTAVTTDGGRTVLVESFRAVGGEGLVAAVVLPALGEQLSEPTGVTLTLTAPEGELGDDAAAFVELLRTLALQDLS